MTTAALLILFAAGPVEATRPCAVELVARVDLIVVNRHRVVQEREEEARVGGFITIRQYSEFWWVSFWEWRVVWIHRTPLVLFVSRGWCAMSDIRDVTPCTNGFAFERNSRVAGNRFTVIAPELRIIDSPFDWEMRHRTLFVPFSFPDP